MVPLKMDMTWGPSFPEFEKDTSELLNTLVRFIKEAATSEQIRGDLRKGTVGTQLFATHVLEKRIS